jgi:hypothetical protein
MNAYPGGRFGSAAPRRKLLRVPKGLPSGTPRGRTSLKQRRTGGDEGHTSVVNPSTSPTQSSAPRLYTPTGTDMRRCTKRRAFGHANGDRSAARRRRRRDRARIDTVWTAKDATNELRRGRGETSPPLSRYGARNDSDAYRCDAATPEAAMPLAAALAALLSWPLEMEADEGRSQRPRSALGLHRRPDDGCTHTGREDV